MYDLVVIGGGSGGLHAARLAAQVGARVALIDRKRPEGSHHIGATVPSKGLVQAARLVRQIKAAGDFGIKAGPSQIDFPAVLDRIRRVSEEGAAAHSDEALRSQGIDVFRGSASFAAYDTVLLDGHQRIEGQRFIIATGARPARPSIPGLSSVGCLDDETVWSLNQVPESLIILGAGPVELEFAQAFARFGSKVTVLTDQEHVLPGVDTEASGHVACMLTGEGVTIRRQAVVEKVESRNNQKVCVCKETQTGEKFEATATEILCVNHRLANVEDLRLETVGVHGDPEHGIEVDDQLQTHAVRIFAIGDVLLKRRYAHFAEREAEIAFENAVLRRRKKFTSNDLPATAFLDPELATVGLTEDQAKAENLDTRVYRASYADTDRARIDGRKEGFAKVVTSPAGKILGATILGEEASLVLQQLVLGMNAGVKLGDLAESTQPFPTYGQLIANLADQQRATRLDGGLRAAALKWLYGFQPRTGNGDGTVPATESSHAEPAAQHHGAVASHGH